MRFAYTNIVFMRSQHASGAASSKCVIASSTCVARVVNMRHRDGHPRPIRPCTFGPLSQTGSLGIYARQARVEEYDGHSEGGSPHGSHNRSAYGGEYEDRWPREDNHWPRGPSDGQDYNSNRDGSPDEAYGHGVD
jgi:hypothetical protein